MGGEVTTPTPEELIAGRKLSDILGQLRGRAQDMENMYGRDFCLKESTAFWAAANLIESLSAQVAQLQGERAALGSWGPIPRYAMLDIWTGLKGHPNSFDAWADSVGYAEAWAQLCQWVRQEVTVPAALGAATQPENEGEAGA